MALRIRHLCIRLGLIPVLLLAALQPSALSADPVLDPNTVSLHTLPNGLRVVVKEAPAINLVALNVWVRAGSACETEENNGVSHFLEHLMFKGTKKRGAGEFDREIEGLGGIANAVTMEDATQYYVVVAKQYVDQAIEALGDVLSNPTFPEAAVRDEQAIILNELAQGAQNPEQVLADWLGRLSFQKHPYRLPTGGTPESVKRITRAKIVEFYEKYYTAQNMSLVVVGAVTAKEILPKIEAAFQGLRQGPPPERQAAPEPAPEKVQHSTLPGPDQRGYLMIGFRSPGMADKDDVCAMDVLLYVLGEKRAQSGRLNRELRQKRDLVSAVWGDYITLRDPGLVTFYAETDPKKLQQARDAILEQVAQLRETLVPEDELMRAKQLLLGVYTLDNETYDGQAGTLGFYEAKDTYEFALEYADRIAKVTPSDVQRVAQKYLGPNNYSLVLMQPKPKTNPPTAPAQAAQAEAPEEKANDAPAN